jgi:phage/plasmid-associated DNA primase
VYGIPHTGKSVLLSVIERIIGEEYVAHTDLAMLQKQEYVANLSGKLINIAPDLKNETLKDVGFFKSLVSHDDQVDARPLYGNPQKVKGETKMVFSSNHPLSFDASLGVYDIEATFNRLLYFPFQCKPIPPDQDNKHLSDEIYAEKDAIFTWAMSGLKDYVENNESFPACKLSAELKEKNMAAYCPEKIFVKRCIKRVNDDVYESSSEIREAFDRFCHEVGVKSRPNISAYLEEHERLVKSKKRIDEDGQLTGSGNPIYVYEGIRLKKKYRISSGGEPA